MCVCDVRYACRTVVGVSLVSLHAEAAAEQQDEQQQHHRDHDEDPPHVETR